MELDVWTYREERLLGSDPTQGIDLTGFEVEALDGKIGKVDEATNEVAGSYLIVDTGPWIFGKKVMLPAGVISRIDTDDERVYVNRMKDQIKNAPEFDASLSRDEEYRRDLGRTTGAVARGTATGTTPGSRSTTLPSPARRRRQHTRRRSDAPGWWLRGARLRPGREKAASATIRRRVRGQNPPGSDRARGRRRRLAPRSAPAPAGAHPRRALRQRAIRARSRSRSALRTALTGPSGLHAIVDVVIEGQKTPHHAVLKDFQQHAIRGTITHVDFHEIRLDQPIQATVTVLLVGDSVGVRQGGVIQQVTREIQVEALPTSIPEHIDVDVSDLDIGEAVRLEDIPASRASTTSTIPTRP